MKSVSTKLIIQTCERSNIECACKYSSWCVIGILITVRDQIYTLNELTWGHRIVEIIEELPNWGLKINKTKKKDAP